MTKTDVIRMAHEANFEGFGNGDWVCTTEEIQRFAALVASERDIHWHKIVHDECEAAIKEEREACAKLCDDQCDLHKEANAAERARRMVQYGDDDQALMALRHHADVSLYNSGIKKCATAIRERKS